MDTKAKDKKTWYYVAVIALVVSIASLFTTILSYEEDGNVYNYNLFGLLDSEDFVNTVLKWYKGKVYWEIDTFWVTLLMMISVIALICAIIGLLTLRQQRPNIRQFWLTIIGLIGTSLPALIVLIAIPVFRDGFSGRLSYGIYPILAPIATLISVIAVYRRKNKVQEELRKELESKGTMWKAGSEDLR